MIDISTYALSPPTRVAPYSGISKLYFIVWLRCMGKRSSANC